jgi:hypothetical protein
MSAGSEKYNTAESVKELVGGVKHQRFNNLKAYLRTLRTYKTKLIQQPDESDVQFETRQTRTKQEFPELHKGLQKNLKEQQIIDLILQVERQAQVGDFPQDVDFKLMASKQKEIGNRLLSVSPGAGKRNNPKQFIPKMKEEDVSSVLELLNLQKSRQATETATAQSPETLIQQQAQSAVGADPNTIIDKPASRQYTITKKQAISDPIVIKGFAQKLRKLEKLKTKGESVVKEELQMMREYKESLASKVLKNPKNEKLQEEFERVSKVIKSKEDEDYVPPPKNKPMKEGEGEVIINPSDPMLGVFADKAMREQPAPRQIATIQAQPTAEEQKQEYDVKLAPAQPQQQAQQQAPQSPKSPKIPPKISNILGGVKQPAPAQPQTVVANASATNGSGDKSIGNVREIGLAPFDQLAKADEVIPPESQRQKSLAVFANMKWIPKGGNNNSVLADLSPFQKLDDIEYNLRYGRTFKINAKRQVQDYHKPAMLKRCASLFTQPQFTPNTKIITVMQPSTPIGFAESNDNKTRNVLINEKEFDKLLPKYSDRPKKYNALSASHGLESYYPNEMIMPPGKDPLQNSSIVIHPDTGTSYFT